MRKIERTPKEAETRLKDPRRRARCRESLSRELPGGKREPPGPRGACEQQSASQGSE